MGTVVTLGVADAGGTGTDSSVEFDALVQAYRPRVFRFLLASLRDRESAENLIQDCFLRAYRARDQFRKQRWLNLGGASSWMENLVLRTERGFERRSDCGRYRRKSEQRARARTG